MIFFKILYVFFFVEKRLICQFWKKQKTKLTFEIKLNEMLLTIINMRCVCHLSKWKKKKKTMDFMFLLTYITAFFFIHFIWTVYSFQNHISFFILLNFLVKFEKWFFLFFSLSKWNMLAHYMLIFLSIESLSNTVFIILVLIKCTRDKEDNMINT